VGGPGVSRSQPLGWLLSKLLAKRPIRNTNSMTESQLLTAALTTVPTMIVILIGILINNARLNDVKETLRSEIRVVEANMDKNQSEMLHRFGDLDSRLTRIENGLGMNRG
jgi:hypothetical protein